MDAGTESRLCLVFDLGGVLIDVAPGEDTLAGLAAASDTPVERLRGPLREAFETRPFSLSERFQAGEVDEAGFLAELDALLVRPLGAERLRAHLEGMLRGEIPGTPGLLEVLAGGHRLACYSNTNPVHWRHLLGRFGFMHHFELRLASHEIGLVKPDERVFRYVESRLDAGPAQCVLIDDRTNNVEAARRAGWTGLPFTGAARLRSDLAALGVAA